MNFKPFQHDQNSEEYQAILEDIGQDLGEDNEDGAANESNVQSTSIDEAIKTSIQDQLLNDINLNTMIQSNCFLISCP